MVFSPIFANLGVLVVCGRCQCGYVRLNSGNLCFCVGRGIHSQIVVVCVVGGSPGEHGALKFVFK